MLISKPLNHAAVLLACTLLVAACGGGGGGGGSSSPPPVDMTPGAEAVADTATTDEDTTVLVDVLQNDTNVTPATLALGAAPAGSVLRIVDQQVEFTPAANFNGIIRFSYQVTGNSGGIYTAEVSITVNPVRDQPVASADEFEVIVNTPTLLAVTNNDTDPDLLVTGLQISQNPTQGSVALDGNVVTYTPNPGFTGSDNFSYQLADNNGSLGLQTPVVLTVVPITETRLEITNLSIPTTGYTSNTHPEFGQIRISAPQGFEIPPNTVSFALALQGNRTGNFGTRLFFANILRPTGFALPKVEKDVIFCDPGLCSGVLPRAAPFDVDSGNWQLQLGNLGTTDTYNPGNNTLAVVTRIGPVPDLSLPLPATLHIKPFLTASTVTSGAIESVLAEFRFLARNSNINLEIDPLSVLTQTRFREVSSDANDPDTADLVAMGAPDRVNLFFVEDFKGDGGNLIGISLGLPGSLGLKGAFNGVLVNATATKVGAPDSFYFRTTAEVAFHETGHFLGLYHTTEKFFDGEDLLGDTPTCNVASDANNDGEADIDECPDGNNIMFWNTDFENNKQPFSDQQKRVVYYSPVATP